MKLAITMAILIMIAGCEYDTGSGYDTSIYDFIDDNTSLRINVQSSTDPDFQHLVNDWYEIQACTGVSWYTAPYVVTVDEIPGKTAGLYYYLDSVIIVEVYNSNRYVLQHEMLHYLMDMNGIDDNNHSSYLFKDCVPNTYIPV